MPLHILVVNFFPAFSPPRSGGEMRLFHLYRELAAEHRVSLLTSTDFDARSEEIAHAPGFNELRFPKDRYWRAAYAALERAGVKGDLSGLAFALAVSEPSCPLRRKALALARSADIVIHEFPYSEPIFRFEPPSIEVYNSHNCEIALLSSLVTGPGSSRCFRKLLRLERSLIGRAKRVFATAPEDGEIMRILYGLERERLSLCPNGYSEAELAPIRETRRKRPRRAGSRLRLLFLGSQHPPNIEAASYLLELAKALPECDFLIAGSVAARIPPSKAPPNLAFLETFDAAGKRRLLEEADIFLNPVVEGSGTSLKAIEALAAGVPVVSTPEGARGLGLEPERDALILPRSEFPAAIGSLAREPRRLSALAEAGAHFARERFAWPVIAQRLGQDLAAVASGAPAMPAPKAEPAGNDRVAIAFNDFSAAAATSGGSVRIRALLGALPFDLVLIAFAERCRVDLIAPRLLQVSLAKSEAQIGFEDAVNRNEAVSVNDIVASL